VQTDSDPALAELTALDVDLKNTEPIGWRLQSRAPASRGMPCQGSVPHQSFPKNPLHLTYDNQLHARKPVKSLRSRRLRIENFSSARPLQSSVLLAMLGTLLRRPSSFRDMPARPRYVPEGA